MSLLVDLMTNTLDEAYADRAARTDPSGPDRTGPGRPPGRRVRGRASITGVAALVLLGLLTGTAVGQVRARAEATAGVRADLVEQAAARTAEGDELDRTANRLRSTVSTTRADALGADAAGRQAADRLGQLELAAGTIPVTGPGLVVMIADAAVEDPTLAEPPDGSTDQGRVIDRDLQDVVNGLWAAGAEAVAVNDVRLSSRAAIRSAGEAILVDFTPLSPPYRVAAVGDSSALEVDFVDGPSGRRLQTLSEFSGITFSVSREQDLSLPAAAPPELRSTRLPGPS